MVEPLDPSVALDQHIEHHEKPRNALPDGVFAERMSAGEVAYYRSLVAEHHRDVARWQAAERLARLVLSVEWKDDGVTIPADAMLAAAREVLGDA